MEQLAKQFYGDGCPNPFDRSIAERGESLTGKLEDFIDSMGKGPSRISELCSQRCGTEREKTVQPSPLGESVNIAECTVPEKILLAAHQLEEQGQSPFSAEALVVAAWQKFPRTFGLKGYTDVYPDSNKVLSSIMGERGLTRRGWLAKMGQKLYALTREGRQVLLRLQEGDEAPPTVATVKIARDWEKHLLTLFSSHAVQKFEEGLKEEVTFADACRFWGITENLHGEALRARLDRTRGVLADVEHIIGTGSAELSNGRSISKDDLNLLAAVHDYLAERFARHLSLLKSRVVRS